MSPRDAAIASVAFVVGQIIIIGVACLVPALAIRYLVFRRPLSGWPAAITAVAISAVLSFVFFTVQANVGDSTPKISPFWWLMAFATNRVLSRGAKEASPVVEAAEPEQKTPLSREEMISGLREMADDPRTPSDRRDWAKDRLAKFERLH